MLQIVVRPSGHIEYIFNDELVSLQDCGDYRIKRVSHVEPSDGGGWVADMSPVLGPVLGPYKLRGEALQAEVEWLRSNLNL